MNRTDKASHGKEPGPFKSSADAENGLKMDAGKLPGRPLLVGLMGQGIQESRTPAMHMAEGARLGMNLSYQLLDIDLMKDRFDPETIIAAAEICGFAGINVTHPYKMAAWALVDDLSPDAEMIGTINAIVFRNGKRYGYNTDFWGFRESFRRNMADAVCGKVVLLGAGGAGSAVAHALADCGVKSLFIFDQDSARAHELANKLTKNKSSVQAVPLSSVNDIEKIKADGIVNASPVGMCSYPGLPLPESLIRPGLWVADIVYFPLETALLRHARNTGCRVLTGERMAIMQAYRSFELFTGITSDAEKMTAVFQRLGKPASIER